MIEHKTENNEVILIGRAVSELKFSHKVYGEGFYTFNLEIPRLSQLSDILPITVSERLISSFENFEGKILEIEGQLRSYNQYAEGKNRLILTVFCLEMRESSKVELDKSKNSIHLKGYICKNTVYRKTPFGREITDIHLAVNRAYHKSDYIPCITWGRTARFADALDIGEHIEVWGRLQSRTYQKKLETGESINKVAYEISISKLDMVQEVAAEDTSVNEEKQI